MICLFCWASASNVPKEPLSAGKGCAFSQPPSLLNEYRKGIVRSTYSHIRKSFHMDLERDRGRRGWRPILVQYKARTLRTESY